MINNKVKNALIRRKNYVASKSQTLEFYEFNAIKYDTNLLSTTECIEIISETQYKDYCNTHGYEIPGEHLRRLRAGSKYYVIDLCGERISSGWLAFNEIFWISEVDMIIDLRNSNTAILYDFETVPDYRGKGWYAKLLHSMIKKNDTDLKLYIIYALNDNQSSNRGIQKAGFNHIFSTTHSGSAIREYFKSLNIVVFGSKYCLFGFAYKKDIK